MFGGSCNPELIACFVSGPSVPLFVPGGRLRYAVNKASRHVPSSIKAKRLLPRLAATRAAAISSTGDGIVSFAEAMLAMR